MKSITRIGEKALDAINEVLIYERLHGYPLISRDFIEVYQLAYKLGNPIILTFEFEDNSISFDLHKYDTPVLYYYPSHLGMLTCETYRGVSFDNTINDITIMVCSDECVEHINSFARQLEIYGQYGLLSWNQLVNLNELKLMIWFLKSTLQIT